VGSNGEMPALLVQVRSASLGYAGRPVLTDINLDIRQGDYVGIVGPNGSGKTTLLRSVLGLLRPVSGEVTRFAGVSVGYVPQRDTVDPTYPLTVLDIVLMGLYCRVGALRRISRADHDASMEALGHVGLADQSDRPFRALSGGQRQRVLLARALAGRPSLLLMDEPTNGMDLPAEHSMMLLVDHLRREHGLTVVMVSHLLNTVVNHVDSVLMVGEGRIRFGAVSEMVSEPVLAALYAMDVQVAQVGSRTVVMPAGRAEGKSDDAD
jgi:ABC-type Mn2+/Zn2+ transport system ATPase subunit